MKELINELIEENKKILHTYPDIENNLRSSAGHRYMFNKEIINKLKNLLLHNVIQQRELLLAYDDWHFKNEQYHSLSREEIIDNYLKANNCC